MFCNLSGKKLTTLTSFMGCCILILYPKMNNIVIANNLANVGTILFVRYILIFAIQCMLKSNTLVMSLVSNIEEGRRYILIL